MGELSPGDRIRVVNPLTYYEGITGTARNRADDGAWWVDLDYETRGTFLVAVFEEWELSGEDWA